MVNAKKGRPPSESPMEHKTLMLPRELLDRLAKDAKASGRTQSGEIRHRLEASYGNETDPKTAILLVHIGQLADEIAKYTTRKWHEHPYAQAAFKAGLDALIVPYQAGGEAKRRPDAKPGEQSDPPDVFGRTHAQRILVDASLKRDLNNGHDA
jgi:hypothetical protein